MWLIAGALVIIATLAVAYRLDHQGHDRRLGPRSLDEVRTRIESNALLGRDWHSSGRPRT